jgi:hypothetical protein
MFFVPLVCFNPDDCVMFLSRLKSFLACSIAFFRSYLIVCFVRYSCALCLSKTTGFFGFFYIRDFLDFIDKSLVDIIDLLVTHFNYCIFRQFC